MVFSYTICFNHLSPRSSLSHILRVKSCGGIGTVQIRRNVGRISEIYMFVVTV